MASGEPENEQRPATRRQHLDTPPAPTNPAFLNDSTRNMSSTSQVELSVIVHKSAEDKSQNRHVYLYFDFGDGAQTYVAHALGVKHHFRFEMRAKLRKPEQSLNFVAKVPVGALLRPTTRDELERHLGPEHVPIKNEDIEFNCQEWVYYALERLATVGLISEESSEYAFDTMINRVQEAELTQIDD